MKRFGLTLLVFLSLIHTTSAQSSDSTVSALLAIDESEFIGKPLDSILNILPSGYIQMRVVSGGHSRTARKLRVKYANEVWIDLHVRVYTHMNPKDNNRVWNVSQMRLENLFKTVIYKDDDCYRNCDVK